MYLGNYLFQKDCDRALRYMCTEGMLCPNFSPQSTSRENESPRAYIFMQLQASSFYKQPAKDAKQGAAGRQ